VWYSPQVLTYQFLMQVRDMRWGRIYALWQEIGTEAVNFIIWPLEQLRNALSHIYKTQSVSANSLEPSAKMTRRLVLQLLLLLQITSLVIVSSAIFNPLIWAFDLRLWCPRAAARRMTLMLRKRARWTWKCWENNSSKFKKLIKKICHCLWAAIYCY